MKAIKRKFKFLFKLILRMRLLSAYIGLILIFLLLTLITYIHINGRLGDKKVVQVLSNSRTDRFDVFDKSSDRMPRIQSYCNPFPSITLNEENDHKINLISELSLRNVFVLIRHGDRGPLRTVRNQSSISLSDASKDNSFHSLAKRFFIEVRDRLRLTLRDRSLFAISNSDTLELGQLSRFGFVQHLNLGSLLGQTYGKKLKITSKELKVYSTPYSRTYQSAVAFVYGFLKPKSVIDFKIFPQITTTYGTFFCMSREFCQKMCKKSEKLHKILNENKKQILSSHPAVLQLIDNLKPIIANNLNESQLFGSPVALFDGLMAYMCHNTGLPCDGKRCVTQEDVKQLVSFIEFHGKQLSASDVFKQLEWLKIYGFLNHLVKRMGDNNIKHKLTLYSGHDITIVALVTALNFFDGVIPPYASRVIFETYFHKNKTDINNNNNNNIYLRIIYNGKDMTRFLYICRTDPKKCPTFDSTNKIQLISLKDFEEHVFERFRFYSQTNQYQTACNQ